MRNSLRRSRCWRQVWATGFVGLGGIGGFSGFQSDIGALLLGAVVGVGPEADAQHQRERERRCEERRGKFRPDGAERHRYVAALSQTAQVRRTLRACRKSKWC